MKKISIIAKIRLLLIAVALLLPLISNAQDGKCGAQEWTEEMKASPEYSRLIRQLEKPSQWKSSYRRVQGVLPVPDTIAVVVYVLYGDSSQIIPDSLIYRQIDILNQDFPRLNSDSGNTPAPFAAIAGRSNFVFHLARRDNNGAATTGIVRWPTTHGPFMTLGDLQQTSSGGYDAWGSSYLNIYCVDIDSALGFTGYAGIGYNLCMIDYAYFGRNSGRLGTHEIGHCLGLRHIWGNELQPGPYSCLSDDFIADTPREYQPNTTCDTFPKFDVCTTSGNGIMYMNYMDYTPGACRNMFSQGQMTYMNNELASSLSDILNSTGLIPVHDFDAGCANILEPNGSECDSVNPVVVIRNWGAQPLTSLTIYFNVDGNTIDSASWNGNLSNFETDTVNLSAISLPAGAHLFSVYTALPNGNADSEFINDTAYAEYNSGSILTVPVSEGFESTFPPYGWIFSSPDSAFDFRLNTSVASLGNNSVDFFSQDFNSFGLELVAGLQTGFSNIVNPVLSFDFAHTYASCCGQLDTLDVLVSDDCGQTYTVVSHLYGDSIATAPADTGFTFLFVPAANQWKHKTVDLSAYAGSMDVLIMFRLENMMGLQFYLDNVNIIDNNVNVTDPGQDYFPVYPNPNTGHFYLNSSFEKSDVEVFQSDGKLIYRNSYMKQTAEINLHVAPGIYFLRVTKENLISNYKIVVE